MGFCYGYVAGVVDMLYTVCLPDGMTRQQVIDVLTLWLRDHPEKRHLPASSLVAGALKEKFPCSAH